MPEPHTATTTRHGPLSTRSRQWLWVNFKIGILSVGSTSRLMLYEEAVVRQYQWVGADQFNEAMTLAQILPGPNLSNFSACLGLRLVPRPVVAAGLLLLVAPGAILAIMAFLWLPLDRPSVRELFRGFSIGAFMLMGKFLWSLAVGLRTQSPVVATTRPAARWLYGPSRVKIAGRYLIALAVGAALAAGLPELPIIGVFALVGLLWEFGLRVRPAAAVEPPP